MGVVPRMAVFASFQRWSVSQRCLHGNTSENNLIGFHNDNHISFVFTLRMP
jgi:hypothetical protein